MKRAILLAALALAGCVTPGADLDAASTSLATLGFAAPLPMDQPTGGAEPNIAILEDGTIFITAVAGSQERPNHEQGAAWLWRSTDGGATFETLRAPARETPLGSVPGTRRPFGSSDADVVASPDGYVYYSDWWNWGTPVFSPVPLPLPVSPFARYGSYLVERSADGGKTWESTPITTLDSFGGIDRQWLVAGAERGCATSAARLASLGCAPDGWVGLFYAYFHGPNPSRPAETPDVMAGKSSIQAVYSQDHGATWSDPIPVVENDASGFSQIAHPRLREDGLLWMPHGWMGGDDWTSPSEVRVALSKDLGATWTQVKVADVPKGFDNLWAVQGDHAGDGVLHVAWAARDAENDVLMGVYHSQSADDGATWSPPVQVSAPGLGFLPWVDAHGSHLAIGFYYADAEGDPVEATDGTAWYPVVARRAADGAWSLTNVTTEPVKTGPMCPRGASCPGDRELLDYFGIEHDAEGALHVSFAQSREVNGVKAGLVTYTRSLG